MTNRSYQFKELPTFPRTLVHWKLYDGWKLLSVFGLLCTFAYLIMGLGGYAIDHNTWIHDLLFGEQIQDLPVKHGWKKVFFWKPAADVISNGIHSVFSSIDLLFRALMFLCSYCIAWAAFDPKNIEGYIMGLFNMIVGMVYILSPLDFIPDAVPLAGSVDDAAFSSGMFTLGAYMFARNYVKEQKTKTILDMVEHDGQANDRNLEKALQLMLRDRGVSIEFTDDTRE